MKLCKLPHYNTNEYVNEAQNYTAPVLIRGHQATKFEDDRSLR